MQWITAATQGYLPYLYCHLGSLAEHSGHGGLPSVTVIHRGLSAVTTSELTHCFASDLRLRWIEPTESFLESMGAPRLFSSASPHYFRLLAPYVLPAASRAIYCDVDTIVAAPLDTLWNTDLGHSAVAATQDYLLHVSDAVGNWEELGLNQSAPYLNSGVLVLDLDRWRDLRIADNVLDICTRHADHLLAQGKWPQFDQYGLNVFLNGQWKPLGREWNFGADLEPNEAFPRIVHFVGNGKAGLPTCRTVFQTLYEETLAKTINIIGGSLP